MRDTFAAVDLINAFLDRGKKIYALGDLGQRRSVGQRVDDVEDQLFLRHASTMKARSVTRKINVRAGLAAERLK